MSKAKAQRRVESISVDLLALDFNTLAKDREMDALTTHQIDRGYDKATGKRIKERLVLDIDLAHALDINPPESIRTTARQHSKKLAELGKITTSRIRRYLQAKPGKAYLLNEAQALLLCAEIDNAKTPEVRASITETFEAIRVRKWQRAGMTPPTPSPQFRNTLLPELTVRHVVGDIYEFRAFGSFALAKCLVSTYRAAS